MSVFQSAKAVCKMQVYRVRKQSGCNRYVMPSVRSAKKVDSSWAQDSGYFFKMQIGVGDVLQNIVTYAHCKSVVGERKLRPVENMGLFKRWVCLDGVVDIEPGNTAEGGEVIGCFIAGPCSDLQNVCIFRHSRSNALMKESSPTHIPRLGKIIALKEGIRRHHFTLQGSWRVDIPEPNLRRLRFGALEGDESELGQIP